MTLSEVIKDQEKVLLQLRAANESIELHDGFLYKVISRRATCDQVNGNFENRPQIIREERVDEEGSGS